MKIIIPMAGSGARFINADYKDPKPMIKVRGKRIVEYVCDMFDRDNDEFVFLCNIDHIRNTNMEAVLHKYVKNCTIRSIMPHKLGPVYSLYTGVYMDIKADDPVMVVYCDTPLVWNYNKFKNFVKDKDGCIVSCSGFHPHSLSDTLWAHSKTDSDNKVLEIKEKGCYTDNHFNEHASAGIYYFKYGKYITKYFKQLIDDDINYNGEYYVTLVYNLLIKDGLSVYSYLSDYVLAFGTPEEVKCFEAWMTILDGTQVKSKEDLINCYNYWMQYVTNFA